MKKSTGITKTKKAKKMIVKVVTFLSAMTLLTITASAAGAVNGTEFVNKAATVLKTLIILIGAGLSLWGVVNLMEAYGGENGGGRSQGIKQLVAGIGLIITGIALVPVLQNMMSSAL